MKVSREAKVLLGVASLAAAILIWVNYFLTQQGQGFNPFGGSGSVISSSPGTASSPTRDGVASVTTPSGSADEVVAEPDSSVGIPTIPATAVSSPEAGAAPVVPLAATAARELVIAELPFLVTSPPSLPVEAEESLAAVAGGFADVEQRANVNPFSPIIVRETAASPVAVSAEPLVVPIPDGPPVSTAVQVPLSQATAPALIQEAPLRTMAPATPQAANLPRPLPGGTLPVTPDILRASVQTSALPISTMSEPLPEPSTLRLPSGAPLPLAEPSVQTVGITSDPELLPLAPISETQGAPKTENAPLYAGQTPLSRFLRDNNVRFTGSVIGPVSVGVFRSNESNVPVVVSLGQSLPNTSIVLTNLTGQRAELTEDQDTQVLILDIRR